jgi:hypothetical protein
MNGLPHFQAIGPAAQPLVAGFASRLHKVKQLPGSALI